METRTRAGRAATSRYTPALDGLRAMCIAAVVLYHLSPAGWIRGGFLGVSVFFTLSGFLITRNLVDELTTTGSVDAVRFWSRRVQRLAPAALVAVAAVIAVTALRERGWSRVGLARDATATIWSSANWNMIDVGPENVLRLVGPLAPMWSLAVEEQFYLGIAILFLVVRGRHALRNLAVVLAFICIASIVTSIVLAATPGGYKPRLEFGTDARAAELAIGALLALAAHHWPALLTRRAGVTQAVGFASLVTLILLFVRPTNDHSWLLSGGFVVVSVLVTLLIVAMLNDGEGTLATAAAWRPVVALGRMSYSLYLVHWPIILLTHDPFLGLSGVSAKVVRLVLCLVCAWVLHVVVEQPARRPRLGAARIIGLWLAASVALSALAFILV
ncbi:MAG: acyltransferase [Ilumatobacteraceae bacterium]